MSPDRGLTRLPVSAIIFAIAALLVWFSWRSRTDPIPADRSPSESASHDSEIRTVSPVDTPETSEPGQAHGSKPASLPAIAGRVILPDGSPAVEGDVHVLDHLVVDEVEEPVESENGENEAENDSGCSYGFTHVESLLSRSAHGYRRSGVRRQVTLAEVGGCVKRRSRGLGRLARNWTCV